jgi:hypothetical protein
MSGSPVARIAAIDTAESEALGLKQFACGAINPKHPAARTNLTPIPDDLVATAGDRILGRKAAIWGEHNL